MALTVNVQEAKTRLSELLARVEKGERVVIARAGTPIANLTPVGALEHRQLGQYELTVPDEFFLPLPDEELAGWE